MKLVTLVTDIGGERMFGDLDVAQLIVQRHGEVITTLKVPATPYAIAVSPSGMILAAGLTSNLDALTGIAGALEVEELRG